MAVLTAVALILSCLGAGRTILNTADWPTRPGPDGTAGLTGLALLTWLAGWIVLAGAYSKTASWWLLAPGCAALLLQAVNARAPRPGGQSAARRPDGLALGLGLASLGLMLARAYGELAVPFFEPTDDWPSYWHFPRLMLESGGFIEPFSLRRLTALGAAPFVQSFFWKSWPFAANGMTDAVLGQLLLWATARQLPDALSGRRQPAWTGEALALAALLVSLTIPNPNSQPTLLPMAGALGLILLTRRLARTGPGTRPLPLALAWGLLAAWLVGLRTSNLAFPAALGLVSALVALRHRDRGQVLALVVAGLATALGLLPWCLTLWQSSGTPLYPLVAGNYRFEGGLYSVPLDGPSLLALVADRLWVSRVWVLALIGLVAATRPGVRRLSLQVVVALLVLVAGSAVATTGLDAITIHRLNASFLAAGAIFFTAAILVPATDTDTGATAPRWTPPPLLLQSALWAGLALWFLLPVTLPPNAWPVAYSNLSIFIFHGGQRLQGVVLAWRLGPRIDDFYLEQYEEVQALLPADARLVSAAERPFLFRFDQQPIHTLDFPFPGVVSPAPGMPYFQGPEPVAEYLRGLGYTHLAFSPTLFARTRDQFGQENEGQHICYRNFDELRPYFLDFMKNVEALHRSYPPVFEARELVLLDLRQPREISGPPAGR